MKKTHLVQLAGAYLFSSCNVLIHYRITPPLFIYLIMHTPYSLNYNRAWESRGRGRRNSPTPLSVDLVIRLISIVYPSNLLSACTNLNLISLPICCMEAGEKKETQKCSLAKIILSM